MPPTAEPPMTTRPATSTIIRVTRLSLLGTVENLSGSGRTVNDTDRGSTAANGSRSPAQDWLKRGRFRSRRRRRAAALARLAVGVGRRVLRRPGDQAGLGLVREVAQRLDLLGEVRDELRRGVRHCPGDRLLRRPDLLERSLGVARAQ